VPQRVSDSAGAQALRAQNQLRRLRARALVSVPDLQLARLQRLRRQPQASGYRVQQVGLPQGLVGHKLPHSGANPLLRLLRVLAVSAGVASAVPPRVLLRRELALEASAGGASVGHPLVLLRRELALEASAGGASGHLPLKPRAPRKWSRSARVRSILSAGRLNHPHSVRRSRISRTIRRCKRFLSSGTPSSRSSPVIVCAFGFGIWG